MKLKVKGMHCPSCEEILRMELEDIDGVKRVFPDHEKGTIDLDFDNSPKTLNKIKEIIKREGYKI